LPRADIPDIAHLMDSGYRVGCLRRQRPNFTRENSSDSEANTPRECRFFYRYHPGYGPEGHLHLHQEDKHRQFLVLVAISSAAFGAVFGALLATLVNAIWF
jgi:hypothetical protein